MHDLIVIGAGPAGMAAAARAAGAGLSVLLLDEQPRAGGQIYRDVARVAGARGALLGKDFTDGLPLVEALDHPNITHLGGAVVWQIDAAPETAVRVAYTRDGGADSAEARRLLIATGALERPMPIPGWTLPGVMTVGAAQILMKQSGVVPENAVLAGAGPLVYLAAAQLVRAGAPPRAVVETQRIGDSLRAAAHLPGALLGWRVLLKGVGLLAELRRAGVARYTAARDLAVEGADHAETLRFTAAGRAHRIEARSVLLHHGVVPNVQATRSLGLPHSWHARQAAFLPVCDGWGRTPSAPVFVAGDGGGIGGATAAALGGEIAALAIAADLGALTPGDRDLAARPLRLRRALELAPRPFIDTAYPPFAEALAPADDTLVCRCEEVTAGALRRAAALGSLGPNQAKAFVRAGMGPCQGRYCGLTVTAILAEANGRSADETGYQHVRPPLKPVTLGELAALDRPKEKTP